MAIITAIDTAEGATSVDIAPTDGASGGYAESTDFQELLDSGVTETTDAPADSSTTEVSTTLSNVIDSAEALSEVNTEETQQDLVDSIDNSINEIGETVENTDTTSESDVDELSQISDEIESISDDLSVKSDSATDPEASEAIDAAAEILDDVSSSIDAVTEAAEVDPAAADQLVDELTSGLEEISETLNSDGTPLEKLQQAAGVSSALREKIFSSYESLLGLAVILAPTESKGDIIYDSTVSKTAVQDVISSEGLDGDVELSPNAAVTDSSLPAAASVNLDSWKVTLPSDGDGDGQADEIKDGQLANFTDSPNMVHNSDGSITFSSQTDSAATTANSKYPRSELREMIRAGDTSIGTHDAANNWVTSAASAEEQAAAGGVDGQMRATLSVDRVTEGGEAKQAGRVIIGQVHAMEDEPVRLYYHKAPGSDTGSIYFAHEPQNGNPETFHVLIGDKSGVSSEGIALGEKFSYDIDITGTDLTVSVTTQDGQSYSEVVDMAQSGYADAGTQMYFKAGVYSQNNTTDPSTDYAEATFYNLETAHNGESLGDGIPGLDGDGAGGGGSVGDGSGTVGDGSGTVGDGGQGTDGSDSSGGSGSGSVGGGGLATEADGESMAASDANQAALEARFIALYEALMEKQVSFKERVEPYKTDNQNAGKG